MWPNSKSNQTNATSTIRCHISESSPPPKDPCCGGCTGCAPNLTGWPRGGAASLGTATDCLTPVAPTLGFGLWAISAGCTQHQGVLDAPGCREKGSGLDMAGSLQPGSLNRSSVNCGPPACRDLQVCLHTRWSGASSENMCGPACRPGAGFRGALLAPLNMAAIESSKPAKLSAATG